MKHNNLIGIDISESSVKVIRLGGGEFSLVYDSVSLPVGVVKKGEIIDTEIFSKILVELISRFKQKLRDNPDVPFQTVLCVPEAQLFTHYCVIPDSVSESEREAYILSDAGKILPFEFDDLYWNYYVSNENGVLSVVFISIQRSVLNTYVKILSDAGVDPVFLTGELFALGHALLPKPPLNEVYLIIDIGSQVTNIGVFGVDAVPIVTISVDLGGDSLTRSVAENLGITLDEAEQQKRKYGFDQTQETTQVPQILRGCTEQLLVSLTELKNYYTQLTKRNINHVIVAGGSALLPHIDNYISEGLGIKTTIADPCSEELFHPKEIDVPKIFLSNLIGLACIDDYSSYKHFNLLAYYLSDEEDSDKKKVLTMPHRTVFNFDKMSLVISNIQEFILKHVTEGVYDRYTSFLRSDLPLRFAVLFLFSALTFLVCTLVVYL